MAFAGANKSQDRKKSVPTLTCLKCPSTKQHDNNLHVWQAGRLRSKSTTERCMYPHNLLVSCIVPGWHTSHVHRPLCSSGYILKSQNKVKTTRFLDKPKPQALPHWEFYEGKNRPKDKQAQQSIKDKVRTVNEENRFECVRCACDDAMLSLPCQSQALHNLSSNDCGV